MKRPASEETTRVIRNHGRGAESIGLDDLVDEADRLIYWRNDGLERAAQIVSQSGFRSLAALIRRQKDVL